jgi:hypothetical protein
MVRGTKGVLQFCQYIDTPQVVHNRKSCHVGTLILIKLFTTEKSCHQVVHNPKSWNFDDTHQVCSQQKGVEFRG